MPEVLRAMPEFTDEVDAATRHIYPKIQHLVTPAEWQLDAPYIHAINRLKRERDAVILAHNYQMAQIYHGIADFTGDSLELARKAADTDASVIVFCGVHFMAETAKLLSPEKTVLLPDMDAGCSLAESITPEDVRALREQYPGVPVVTYINTSAAIKAEVDICCTSSNAVKIVESLGSDRVIFLPDGHLARYVAAQTGVEIINWEGRCIVHDEFDVDDLEALRKQHPEIRVIVHPECNEDVQKAADMVGSTAQLHGYVDRERPEKVAMITECTMADNVSVDFPDTQFIQPCSLCPYMRKITLKKVLATLEYGQHEIVVPPRVAERARLSVQRMMGMRPAAAG
jgi:quinolinate synthase